jgi:PhnB protein
MLTRERYAICMPKAANPIPAGFHSVTVQIAPDGAAGYIDFLKRAFHAVELERSPGPGGKLLHATMRIGDSILMLADDFAEMAGLPPLARGRFPFTLNLYVPDADAVWKDALAAGCEVVMPIADQFWGDRYGLVRDPFGFMWSIASRQEDLTPEEMHARAAKIFGGGGQP